MHYCVLVFLEDGKLAKDCVKEMVDGAMEPYGNGIEWDWFQIGGRWTGYFDGYDPEKDPKNKRKCQYCNGTGKRKDMKVANGCNGCGGTGKETLWPSDWKFRKKDVIPVKKLTQKQLDGAYAVRCDGWGWYGGEEYTPWKDPKSRLKPRGRPPLAWLKKTYPKGVVVVVDCHN